MKKNKKIWRIPEPIRIKEFPGGWPVPYFDFINIKNIEKILEKAPRLVIEGDFKEKIVNINEMINGGIKIPHLHMKEDIVFLEKPMLKKYLYHVADELDNIKDFGEFHNYIK
jgi:hypothetical protein